MRKVYIFLMIGATAAAGTTPTVMPPAGGGAETGAGLGSLRPVELREAAVFTEAPEKDAFGVVCTGSLAARVVVDGDNPGDKLAPQVKIEDVAAKVRIDGVLPGREVICQAVVLPIGSSFTVLFEHVKYTLTVKAVTAKEVVFGWSRDASVARVALADVDFTDTRDAPMKVESLDESKPELGDAPAQPAVPSAVQKR